MNRRGLSNRNETKQCVNMTLSQEAQ
ncbi:kinetoplast-associated protein-like protein, partial [Leishmania donovani]